MILKSGKMFRNTLRSDESLTYRKENKFSLIFCLAKKSAQNKVERLSGFLKHLLNVNSRIK